MPPPPGRHISFEDYVRERLGALEKRNEEQTDTLHRVELKVNQMEKVVTTLGVHDARRTWVERLIAGTFIVAGVGWVIKAVFFLGAKM